MTTSIPLQPTITAAGLTAIFNAQSTGVEFALSHIAFGTAQYTPDGSETALRVEKVRVPIAGGGPISPTQIQIYAIAMAAAGQPFFVGEIGFFGDDGATLLAVYSSTGTPSLYLSDTVATSVSYALGLAALPANSVTVTIDPSASAALLLMGNHVTAADPHPQYVEKENGVAFYDPTLTFNLGAEIIGDDLLVYQSAQADNIGNLPSTSPAWWVPLFNYGNSPVAGLTNANVTLTSTQAARAHITLSGALTAPINVVFPNWVKEWTVLNKTTGAFSLTCKTAAGTGIAIPQNSSPTRIYGDGTNITQAPENVASAIASQHAAQFGQLPGMVGSVRNLVMSVAAASASATLTADGIVVATALNGLQYLLPSFNKTINLATTGAGGMDTGTAPVSGFVALYAIWNPTTSTAALLATNATIAIQPNVYGGTLPSGYTASALVSVWPTNGSGQFAPAFQQDRQIDILAAQFLSTTSVVSNASASIASLVPKNAKSVKGYMQIGTSAATPCSITLIPSVTLPVGQVQYNLNTAGSTSNNYISFAGLMIAQGSQALTYSTLNGSGTSTFSAGVGGYSF